MTAGKYYLLSFVLKNCKRRRKFKCEFS